LAWCSTTPSFTEVQARIIGGQKAASLGDSPWQVNITKIIYTKSCLVKQFQKTMFHIVKTIVLILLLCAVQKVVKFANWYFTWNKMTDLWPVFCKQRSNQTKSPSYYISLLRMLVFHWNYILSDRDTLQQSAQWS
jgi:hypothetical protein